MKGLVPIDEIWPSKLINMRQQLEDLSLKTLQGRIGQTFQTLGSLGICHVVNFNISVIVKMCSSWSEHLVITVTNKLIIDTRASLILIFFPFSNLGQK